MKRMGLSVACLLAMLCFTINAKAALVVDLAPSNITGSGATWTNAGTLGGQFDRLVGTADVSSAAGGVSYIGGDVPGIDVDDEVFRSSLDAPAGITGNAARTTEVWVLNPTVEDDEALVGWGRRGASSQLHMLNYGTNGDFGALGLWGGADTPYTGGVPSAGQWHHIAYVFDGVDNYKVYVDGVVNVNETVGTLDTQPGAINLFAQNQADGTIADPDVPGHVDTGQTVSTNFSGSLNSVKIWDEVRTGGDILANFNAGPVGWAGPGGLTLTVNTTTGEMSLTNNSLSTVSLDYYQIESAGNALEFSNWNSLEDQQIDAVADTSPAGDFNGDFSVDGDDLTDATDGFEDRFGDDLDGGDFLDWARNFSDSGAIVGPGDSWQEGGGSDDGIFVEAFLKNDGTFAPSETISLGTSFDPSVFGVGVDGDLVFQFGLDGQPLEIGNIEYVTSLAATQLVPEPTTAMLALCPLAILLLKRKNMRMTLALLPVLIVVSASNVQASVTVDRDYQLGDDAGENAVVGQVVGSAFSLASRDSAASAFAGSRQSLNTVGGNPLYADVSARPGASPGSIGAVFDGNDSLTRTHDSSPLQVFSRGGLGFPGNPIPQNPADNYVNIFRRGIQAWVNPDASMNGSGVRHDVVNDTYQYGIHIAPDGDWAMTWGSDSGGTTGNVIESDADVSYGTWAHVHQHSFGTDMAILYVNGEAVAAAGLPGNTYHDNNQAADLSLSVGAGLGATGDFFTGVIDDVKIYVEGENTGDTAIADRGDGFSVGSPNGGPDSPSPGMDYGTFVIQDDNEFIVNALSGKPLGDLDLDGLVNSTDVNIFVSNWLTSPTTINGITGIADLNSYMNGDINFDGTVDIEDAFLMHQGLGLAGMGGLNFNLLSVPEPGACALLLVGAACLPLTRFSNRK